MKKPNISPAPWATVPEFKGHVIYGEVSDSPRGKSAHIICRVHGECLPAFKANLQAIAALPDILDALENLRSIGRAGIVHVHETGKPMWSALEQVTKLAEEALTKAGYTF